MNGHAPARMLAAGLSLLLVGYGAVVLASLLARGAQTRHATYTGVRVVELDTSFEGVEVTMEPDARGVDLRRHWTWSLGEPTVTAARRGDRLVISSSCPFSPGLPCRGLVRLTVAPDVVVTGDVADGHLLLDGLSTPVDVSCSDGRLELRDLSGPLRLASKDGAVRATGLTSDRVVLESADGSVRLGFARPPGSVRATTRDGSVDVALPGGGTAYDVSVEVTDGSREVRVPTASRSPHKVTVRTTDGAVRVTSGGTTG